MATLSFGDLNNKVCVITGGAGIIGRALATGLCSNGVKVILLNRNIEKAEQVALQISADTGSTCVAIKGDVVDRASLESAKKVINDRFGRIDFLINGAGGNSPKATSPAEVLTPDLKSDLSKTFFGLDMAGFEDVFKLNFMGTILPTTIFSQDMLEHGGAIVNISSMSAYHPMTKVPAYSAAKSAVNNITEWLAVHLAPVNIRVNAVAPGFFLTEQNRFLLTDEKTGELTARGHKIIRNTPMGRFGKVDELQGAVNFLLSDMARFITGVCIPIDGGFNAFSGV